LLTKDMQLAIIDARNVGKTIDEVRLLLSREYGPDKVPSDATLRRYYNRNPDQGLRTAQPKPKAFDVDPFRDYIITILRNNPKACASSVYDVLKERFIKSGEYTELPASLRSLQNYVNYLRKSELVQPAEKEGRVYDHVFDTPPGDQLLIDFGDYNLGGGIHYYFICLLLRYSRYLVAYGQDHKYNSEEACRDIYRCFVKLGGRPKRLVIDQDAVFISSETYGEVIKTQVFEGFCKEQKLDLFVCRKADPESKGPIENSVRYLKTSYLSARADKSPAELERLLPGWLDRANHRIHGATCCVPYEVYEKYEKENLQPLLPSLYNNSPRAFIETSLENYPYILYRSCKYYYPSEYAFKQVWYRVVDDTIYLYDSKRELVTTYPVSQVKGKSFQHDGYRREPTKYLDTIEHMRLRWDCEDFQHFVNGVKKESKGRYLNDRFAYISNFLDSKNPDPRFVARVLKYCCEHFRYTPTQFTDSYSLLASKGDSAALPDEKSAAYDFSRDINEYQKVFDNRVNQSAVRADKKEDHHE